jgi:hypothetical protein
MKARIPSPFSAVTAHALKSPTSLVAKFMLTVQLLFHKSSIPTSSLEMSLKRRTTARVMFAHEIRKDMHNQLAAILDTKAGKQTAQVRTNSWYGHAKGVGDLLVGMPQKKLLDNFGLAW